MNFSPRINPEDCRESESKLDEKIEVFNDLTDRYETITRRQYDPAIHFIKVRL